MTKKYVAACYGQAGLGLGCPENLSCNFTDTSATTFQHGYCKGLVLPFIKLEERGRNLP